MAEPATVANREVMLDNELTVATVLALFDGDVHKALASALKDIEFLRRELAFASLAMSYGFARGWRPSVERPVDRKPDSAQGHADAHV